MFSWSQSLRAAVLAARRNFWPGLFLQALLLLFLAAYLWHEPTQKGLATVAGWKQEAGFLFAAFSFLLASAFLPELLRVLFFQKGRLTRQNWWNFLTSAPLWMGMGVLIDLFYRLQLHLFGDGSDWAVLLPKVLVDQFLFSPFIAQPIIVCYLTWRDARYATSVWPGMLRLSVLSGKSFAPAGGGVVPLDSRRHAGLLYGAAPANPHRCPDSGVLGFNFDHPAAARWGRSRLRAPPSVRSPDSCATNFPPLRAA